MFGWFVAYLLPTSLSFVLARQFKSTRHRLVVVHLALALSIIIFSVFGASLHWSFNPIMILIILGASGIAITLLGGLGFWYVLSSLLQEWCLLLAALWGMDAFGPVPGALVTTIVFSFMHLLNRIHWEWKISLTFLWGVLSIILYLVFPDPLLNTALHIAFGSALIRSGVMFPNRAKLHI